MFYDMIQKISIEDFIEEILTSLLAYELPVIMHPKRGKKNHENGTEELCVSVIIPKISNYITDNSGGKIKEIKINHNRQLAQITNPSTRNPSVIP